MIRQNMAKIIKKCSFLLSVTFFMSLNLCFVCAQETTTSVITEGCLANIQEQANISWTPVVGSNNWLFRYPGDF